MCAPLTVVMGLSVLCMRTCSGRRTSRGTVEVSDASASERSHDTLGASKEKLAREEDRFERLHSEAYTGGEVQWIETKYGARRCDRGEREEFEELFGVKLPTKSDLKIVSSNASHVGRILYLYPDEDESEAFTLKTYECYRILNWARKYADVRLIHVSSILEAQEILSLYPPRSIQHLVVGGHGTGTTLTFNSNVTLGELAVWDPHTIQFWELVRSKMMGRGSLFIESCNNAKDDTEWNHLNFVARILPNHRVFASRISFSRDNIVVRDFGKGFSVLVRDGAAADGDNTGSVHNYAARGSCQDEPSDSIFLGKFSCAQFAEQGLCLTQGWVLGERPYPHSFEQGVAAQQACCKCGGGVLPTNSGGACPARSITSGDKLCKCLSQYRCVQSNGESCPGISSAGVGKFPKSCTDCYCMSEIACPAWTYRGTLDGHCLCKPGSQCHSHGEKGCPTRTGVLSVEKFVRGCKDCICKNQVAAMPNVDCKDGACMCQDGARCFKGDREGQCPAVGSWGTAEVGMLSERFDAKCIGCECRLPCPGDAYSTFARHGVCECLKSDGEDQLREQTSMVGCFKDSSLSNGCPSPRSKIDPFRHDLACRDCLCVYQGPWKVGQHVRVCDLPCESYLSGAVTSVRGGEVMVTPDGWEAAFKWSKVEDAEDRNAEEDEDQDEEEDDDMFLEGSPEGPIRPAKKRNKKRKSGARCTRFHGLLIGMFLCLAIQL